MQHTCVQFSLVLSILRCSYTLVVQLWWLHLCRCVIGCRAVVVVPVLLSQLQLQFQGYLGCNCRVYTCIVVADAAWLPMQCLHLHCCCGCCMRTGAVDAQVLFLQLLRANDCNGIPEHVQGTGALQRECVRGPLKMCHGEGHQDGFRPAVLCTAVPHLPLLVMFVCPDGHIGLIC